MEQERPSTRVFTPPASLNLFSTEVQAPVAPPPRRDPNASAPLESLPHSGKKMCKNLAAASPAPDMDELMMLKNAATADANVSHFSLAPAAFESADLHHHQKKQVENNPNYTSHWSISGSSAGADEFIPGKKVGSADANASHFSIAQDGIDSVVGDEQQVFHSGKKMMMQKDSRSSDVPIAVFERPSSRVLVYMSRQSPLTFFHIYRLHLVVKRVYLLADCVLTVSRRG